MSKIERTNPRFRGMRRTLLLAASPLILLLAFAAPAGAAVASAPRSINTNLSAQAPSDGCSSTSTLAQANQSPQQVLRLLRDGSTDTTDPNAQPPQQQKQQQQQQQLQQLSNTQSLSQANDNPTDTTAPCPNPGDNASGLAKTQQRLSTGQKINSNQVEASGESVTPLAQCSYKDKGGVFRTVFGYDAKLRKDVTVPVGPKNILNPKDLEQNQVTTFSDGAHDNAFIVSSKEKVQWSLGGQVVTGPVDQVCKDHPVPVSGAVVPAVVLTLVAIPLAGWFSMSRKSKKPKVAA